MNIQSPSKYSMLVKCEKCGYENFPQHRFCGMCGAELPSPVGPPRPNLEPLPPAPKPVKSPSPAIPMSHPSPAAPTRSSPIALEQERVDPRSVSYLLEDEPAPSHWGRYVLLGVLVAGLAAGWYWRAELGPFATQLWRRGAGGSAQSNASASAAPDVASPATTTPVSGANAGAPNEKPAAPDQAAASPAQTPPSSAPAAAAPPSAADSTPQPGQSQAADQAPSSDSAAANVSKGDDSEEPANQPAPAVTRPKVRARPATSAAAVTDDAEAEAEKYLYGNGVPENCARARKDLLAAAQRNNAKAQNVLGTMYATGHCATRDLPTAYRWFGRSLRQDPGNKRIEQDLKVLWSQMTPEEQRLALRDTK